MIAALRGRVLRTTDDGIVVDVHGVGYEVICDVRTQAAVAGRAEVDLHVHTGVSDDAIRLYGFRTPEELRLFRLLIGVERIGPRAALAILGRNEPAALVRVIRSRDAKLLATVPGVGPKTAERVVLELSDKLDDVALPGDSPGVETPAGHRVVEQATAALVGLGFREIEVRAALAAADGAGDDVNALITAALRRLDRSGAPV